MSTWRRILTTADTTNNNLASQDLQVAALTGAGESFERTFRLPSASVSSALVFKGFIRHNNLNNQVRPMLRIDTDYNSSSVNRNYVYASALRVGSISSLTVDGTHGTNGYGLPQFDENDDGGKFLVTSREWTSASGDTEFIDFEDIVGPNGMQVDDAFDGVSDVSGSDSVLVYDLTAGKFKHLSFKHFPRSYCIQAGRNEYVNYGSYFMRGVNGVPMDADDDDSGIVIPEDCFMTKLSFGFLKATGSGSHRRKVRIWVNGTQLYETTYAGASVNNNTFVHQVYDEFKHTATNTMTDQFFLSAGSRVAFEVYNTSSYPGHGDNFQVSAVLNTFQDDTP